MEKTGAQKALKFICIVWIVIAILGIISGALMTGVGGFGVAASTNSSLVSSSGTDATSLAGGGTIALLLGIGVLITAILQLIIAIFGLRGANNPSKIGVFFVLCIIGLVCAVIGVVCSIAQGADGTTIGSNAISCIMPLICLLLANSIKKIA